MIRKDWKTRGRGDGGRTTSANEWAESILLVEDDAITAKAMTRLFSSVGVALKAVGTVKEGLEALSHIPAVVILDLTLPDGSGVQVLEAIRAAGLRCKVAIVSGSTDPSTFDRVRAAKPDAIFPKPLDFEDLVQWLCEAFPEEGEGAIRNAATPAHGQDATPRAA